MTEVDNIESVGDILMTCKGQEFVVVYDVRHTLGSVFIIEPLEDRLVDERREHAQHGSE